LFALSSCFVNRPLLQSTLFSVTHSLDQTSNSVETFGASISQRDISITRSLFLSSGIAQFIWLIINIRFFDFVAENWFCGRQEEKQGKHFTGNLASVISILPLFNQQQQTRQPNPVSL
jgi:hypothetical protein